MLEEHICIERGTSEYISEVQGSYRFLLQC